METPKVSNILQDKKNKIVFEVLAYRTLTREELIEAYAYFRTTKEGRRLKKNMRYTILSLIGARD